MSTTIIDRSPYQKRARVNQLRAELLDLGYSVVTSQWLHSHFDKTAAKKALTLEASQ